MNRASGQCIDPEIVAKMASKVKALKDMGCDVAIVLGGGNIFRGATGEALGIDRCAGDYMGMLATIINALALQNAIEKAGMPARVMTAFRTDCGSDLRVRFPVTISRKFASWRAPWFGTKPNRAMVSLMRSSVSGFTLSGWLSAFETVPSETPATRATSLIFTFAIIHHPSLPGTDCNVSI